MTAPRTDTDTGINEFLDLVSGELQQALSMFQDAAACILEQSGVSLNPPAPSSFSLENHFFSALFLYSYIRGGIAEDRRIYYAAMNQCLRGIVTGCDNILDDEYKITLDTDLPESATKFRSILDIMVCDRILTALMVHGGEAGIFFRDQLLTANTVSLQALLKSGAQEASEEQGVMSTLLPEVILSDIHSVKTGLLFQAPWALPEALEGPDLPPPDRIKGGLALVGMGCQVMDDMVDLARDLETRRHNYVASLICHASGGDEAFRLKRILEQGGPVSGGRDLLNEFPRARKQAANKARAFLEKGCGVLLAPEHCVMIPFVIGFLTRRIGADRFQDLAP
jgi:hypothetical protein